MTDNDNFFFKGTKLIKYDHERFNKKKILESLIYLRNRNEYPESIEIYDINNSSIGDIKLLENKIRSVLLLSPFTRKDKREESIGITSSSIFLGSALTKNGFSVRAEKLNLEKKIAYEEMGNPDMIGITLFEDFFPEIKHRINEISASNNFFTAAGGPFVSLNPLQAIYQLQEVNLFVRGEAEVILPDILTAINNSDLVKLSTFDGFLFRTEGIIFFSNLSHVNRPNNFNNYNFDLDFLNKDQLKNGLEINFSRGCGNSCLFCSHVQGKVLRKLPPDMINQLLDRYDQKLKENELTKSLFRTININDDDILQDPKYTESIMEILNNRNFSMWGIQSSINSLFDKNFVINEDVLNIIADKITFVREKLIWIGTDTFISSRGKRLGKRIPPKKNLERLIETLEKKNIMNFHYWIISDFGSSWKELIEEVRMIRNFSDKYSNFGILPHSPFLIPYSSTPVWKIINSDNKLLSRIKFRFKEITPFKEFNTFIPERIETGCVALNRMLNPALQKSSDLFTVLIKNKEFHKAFIMIYESLKEERIKYSGLYSAKELAEIEKAEEETFEIISSQFKNNI